MPNPFSRKGRKLRLRTWRSDMTTFGAGLASLAVAASLGAAQLFGTVLFAVLGAFLLVRGVFQPVPLVDVEEPWNAKLDQLRDAKQLFTHGVADPVYDTFTTREPWLPGDWRTLAREIRLPYPDER